MTAQIHDPLSVGATKIGGSRRSFLDGITPPAWTSDALCAQVDGDLFFPEKGGSSKEAKKVCAECPIRVECLQYALDHGERYGIYGGLSERERRKLQPRKQNLTLTCEHCGNSFNAARSTVRFCSNRCSNRARLANRRGTCIDCGAATSEKKFDRCHNCAGRRSGATLWARRKAS